MAKAKEKSQAIATQPKGAKLAILDQRPAYLDKYQGPARGLETLDASDLTLPRLALAQSGTPQRKKSNPKFITGLDEGQFFNTISKEVYGEEVLFVPLFSYKSRIKFNDFEDGGGIDCQSFNGKTGGKHCAECSGCQFAQFGADGEAPECDTLYNYPSLVLHNGKAELAVLSLKSTGIKVAKQFNSLMKLVGGDAFSRVYKISSAAASAKGNDYYAVDVNPAGFPDEETYNKAEAGYKALYGKAIKVDDQEGQNTKREKSDSKEF